jgi:putative component of toxin-antitoxin plasmid stabilization module
MRRAIEVRETPEFIKWLAALKDQRAILHIVRRISRVAAGNPAMPSRSVVR